MQEMQSAFTKRRLPKKLSGCFSKLIRGAKTSQEKRYIKKGGNVPAFALTKEYMNILYDKQNGLGFYSHIQLNLRRLSDWQLSLERLDRNRDYVHSNVVLEACEFNAACQWNLDKIMQIPLLICAPCTITLDELNDARIR
eukprot:304355_1